VLFALNSGDFGDEEFFLVWIWIRRLAISRSNWQQGRRIALLGVSLSWMGAIFQILCHQVLSADDCQRLMFSVGKCQGRKYHTGRKYGIIPESGHQLAAGGTTFLDMKLRIYQTPFMLLKLLGQGRLLSEAKHSVSQS
jgi:hypothetical protein